MLSAAHVLAMDAKNLLDVVDSLRIRHPELFINEPTTPSTPTTLSVSSHFDVKQISSPATVAPQNYHQQDDMLQRQTYENMSQIQNKVSAAIGQQNSPPSSMAIQQQTQSYDCELYANQQQQQSDKLYDNECVINHQMKSLEIDNTNNTMAGVPSKPPLAAKPSNLQQKLKSISVNSRQSIESNGSSKNGTESTNVLDEQLKIVEDDREIYSNSSVSNEIVNETDANTTTVVMTSLLPEPVPCAVVQENVFQKVMSNKMG